MEQLILDNNKIAIDLDDETLPASIRVLEPTLYEDGDDYCCVFGPRRDEAIFGMGHTPRQALIDWDKHLQERRAHAEHDPLIHYVEDRLRDVPRFSDEGVPVGATDENEEQITLHDILHDGSDYYHLYRTSNGRLDAISCTKGYLHDLSLEELHHFRRVGSFTEFNHMLLCD
ncbi:MAG: hypothetical protein JWQ78_844 [Sediminibacterium sp.]|nr:hypothetical protein [Sediminibacterium sp.]